LRRFQMLGEGTGFQDGDGAPISCCMGKRKDLPLYSK